MTEKEREEERNRLLAVLKRNPNCVWARNELKYLDIDEPNVTTGGIMISSGAYYSDRIYHGGYTE